MKVKWDLQIFQAAKIMSLCLELKKKRLIVLNYSNDTDTE